MSLDATQLFDYVVIGGGCLGASITFALITENPRARIGWFTGTKASTASSDFLKIIRDAYPDKLMSEYANRALQAWETASPFSDYYHRTGWIQVIAPNARKPLNTTPDDERLTLEDMMERTRSAAEPILDEGEELFLNPGVGYADSALAVTALSNITTERGVERYEMDVTELVVAHGKCAGVVAGGLTFKANCTIVSAGAWTPGLLRKSNVNFSPELFLVTGVGVATLSLSDEELDTLKGMPILVTENGMYHSLSAAQ